MIYCDSSLLVAALTVERHSGLAGQWLDRRPFAELAISPWVSTEVASALAMKQRQGLFDAERRAAVEAGWRVLAADLPAVPVEAAHFVLAEALVDSGARGLRAADALHVAIARSGGFALATLDRGMADAAEAVGMEVALRPPD